MNVIIMRGLPGSGKTTWVQKFVDPPKVICSADDFHTDDKGVYRYDPKKAGQAHDVCFHKYLGILQSDFWGNVIVDNTNTTLAEIAPYARVASALGEPFKIMYVYCDIGVAYRRGIHNVPVTTMIRMWKALLSEEVPPYWPQEIVGL